MLNKAQHRLYGTWGKNRCYYGTYVVCCNQLQQQLLVNLSFAEGPNLAILRWYASGQCRAVAS